MDSKDIKDVEKALKLARKDGYAEVLGIVRYWENDSFLNYMIRQNMATVREYNGVHLILKTKNEQ